MGKGIQWGIWLIVVNILLTACAKREYLDSNINTNQESAAIRTVSYETDPELFQFVYKKVKHLGETLTFEDGLFVTYTPGQVEEPYILQMPQEIDGETVRFCGEIAGDAYVREVCFPDTYYMGSVEDCGQLQKVTFSRIASLCVFDSCQNLTEVVFPANRNLSIPNMVTFRGCNQCDQIESVQLPCNVFTLINAFQDNKSLKEVELMQIRDIKDSFNNCPNLETLDLTNVLYISGTCFTGCDKLTLLVKKGSVGEEYAIEHDIPYKYV